MDWWRPDLRNHFRASVQAVLKPDQDLRLCDAVGNGGILPDPVFPDKLTRSYTVFVQRATERPQKFWVSHAVVEHSLREDPYSIEIAFAKWLSETFK